MGNTKRIPMKTILSIAVITLCTIAMVSGEAWFEQNQFDDSYASTLVERKDTYGEWAVENGSLKTSQDAKFYAIAAPFAAKSNEGKTMVIQFAANIPSTRDCGGDYVKVLKSGENLDSFNGDTEYSVMFGPDICGATNKIHLIFNSKSGSNELWKKTPRAEKDGRAHMYTAIIRSDNTYEVRVDNEAKESGSLEDDWDLLPA